MKRLLLILGAVSALAAAQAHADTTLGRDAANTDSLVGDAKPVFPRPRQPKADAVKPQADKLADGVASLPAIEGQSFEQLLVLFPEFTKEKFTQADTDGDGVLNSVEMERARAAGMIPA